MVNTIDNNGSINRQSILQGQSSGRVDPNLRSAEPRAAAHSQSPAGGDHVQFSDSVALLQSVQSRIESEPVVNESRVEAARTAIADGSYEIDHSQIATNLLALERDLP